MSYPLGYFVPSNDIFQSIEQIYGSHLENLNDDEKLATLHACSFRMMLECLSSIEIDQSIVRLIPAQLDDLMDDLSASDLVAFAHAITEQLSS